MEKVGVLSANLENVMAISHSSWTFGSLVTIWYIFPHFGILCQEKSGNPESNQKHSLNRNWLDMIA
jgi:hypothetical protein